MQSNANDMYYIKEKEAINNHIINNLNINTK